MSNVINRRTVTIAHVFDAGNPFTRKIYLGFEPDEMFVSMVTYSSAGSIEVLASVIQTDLVQGGDGIIAHICPLQTDKEQGVSTFPRGIFTVDKLNVNTGVATFRILTPDINNTFTQNVLCSGLLFLTLEFVQYHK